MGPDSHLTLAGNLTADPELHHSRTGLPVTSVIVASTPRHYDREADIWVEDDTIYLRCTAWRTTAQNIADTLHKGDRVLVTGRLRQHTYTTGDSTKSTLELDIDDIGRSLLGRPKPASGNGATAAAEEHGSSAPAQP